MQPTNDLIEHCDRNRDEAKERLKEKEETGEMYMGRRRREGWIPSICIAAAPGS